MPVEKLRKKPLIPEKVEAKNKGILAAVPKRRISSKSGEKLAVQVAFTQSIDYFKQISKNDPKVVRFLSRNFSALKNADTYGDIKYFRAKDRDIYAISTKSENGIEKYILSVGKNEMELAKDLGDGKVRAIYHNSKTNKLYYS